MKPRPKFGPVHNLILGIWVALLLGGMAWMVISGWPGGGWFMYWDLIMVAAVGVLYGGVVLLVVWAIAVLAFVRKTPRTLFLAVAPPLLTAGEVCLT